MQMRTKQGIEKTKWATWPLNVQSPFTQSRKGTQIIYRSILSLRHLDLPQWPLPHLPVLYSFDFLWSLFWKIYIFPLKTPENHWITVVLCALESWVDLQKDGQHHTVFDGHKVSDNIDFSVKLESIIIKDVSWVAHTNVQKYTHANMHTNTYLHI